MDTDPVTDQSKPQRKTGHRLLLRTIARRGLLDYEAAKEIGCAKATLSQILDDEICATPGLLLAARMDVWSEGGIPIRSWLPVALRRRLPRAA